MIDKPENLKGFKVLAELYKDGDNLVDRIWDTKIIEKVTKLANDMDFLTKLGGGNAVKGLADLTKVIAKNKNAPCCGKTFADAAGDVNRHLESLDKYLEDVLMFTKDFSGVEGASTMISLLKNGQRYQIDAMAQTMRHLRESKAGDIIKFEPRLENVLNAADDVKINQVGDILIMFQGGQKLIELKAWYKNGLSRITSNSKFFNQFKAYLNNDNITDISKLDYIFDARKLVKNLNGGEKIAGNAFETILEATNEIKKKFKKLYEDKAVEIFEANPKLFENLTFQGEALNIDNISDFMSNIDFHHSLFDFIKVQ